MKKIKSCLFNLIAVTVPTLIFIVLFFEFVVFRFIVPASDMNLTYFDSKYGILKSTPGMSGRSIEYPDIDSHFSINNEGWNSPREYTSEKTPGVTRIAVIGDSFILSMMVDIDKSMPYVMEDRLDASGFYTETYSFGYAGSPMSQYLQVMRYVAEEFDPDIYIVNIVHNDYYASMYNIRPFSSYMTYNVNEDGTFEEMPPAPYKTSGLRRHLYRSSIVRFFYLNVGMAKNRVAFNIFRKKKGQARDYEGNIDTSLLDDKDTVTALTGHIIGELKVLADSKGKPLLLVFDTPRHVIYEGKDPRESEVYQLNLMAQSHADRLGVPYLDLTDTFLNDYAKNHKQFDFKEDAHWNAYAHGLAGNAVADYLMKNNWLEKD